MSRHCHCFEDPDPPGLARTEIEDELAGLALLAVHLLGRNDTSRARGLELDADIAMWRGRLQGGGAR